LCAAGAGCYPHFSGHFADTLSLAIKKKKKLKKIRKTQKPKKKFNCTPREKAPAKFFLF
jgi:hypothetical protein